MSLWTTLGDAFSLGSDVVGAAQSPADQGYLRQIPVWKAAALRGDSVAYQNLQYIAGNVQGGSPASGYVQGVAQAALQEVDGSTTLAQGAGAGAGILTAAGNALNPQGFWTGFSNTLGVNVQSVQLTTLVIVGVILYLIFRKH